MPIQVIVLNGGSSSGKSTIARRLQSVLPRPWLTFGTDDMTVDTTATEAQECALAFAARLG